MPVRDAAAGLSGVAGIKAAGPALPGSSSGLVSGARKREGADYGNIMIY